MSTRKIALKKEPSSTLIGKIAATLIGIACAQTTNGKINFATPFVDDEGVDLIFFKKGGGGRVILAQVKSRTTESKLLKEKGNFRVQVRRASFKPREGYYFIFTILQKSGEGLLDTIWFIPSGDFKKRLAGQTNKSVLVFQSMLDSKDMWEKYRMNLNELPQRIIEILEN